MLAPVAWLSLGNGTGRVTVDVSCHDAAPPPLFGAWQVFLGSCLVHRDLSVRLYT